MLRDTPSITIGDRRIGAGAPPFVIAEIGLNHGGDPARALALVDHAADAGADAIKLQTLFAKDLVAASCPAPAHVAADSLVEFFEQFELDEAAHRAVIARARRRGLSVLSTPFSESAVELLERIGVDAFKIASGDLTYDQLIAGAAATRKPLVISTGMSDLDEVRHAMAIARLGGATEIALLHCVSAYPVPAGSENLQAIRTLAETFHVPVGLSDHAPDTFALPMAIALGGSIFERHLALDGDDDAIDRAVSSTPAEFGAAVATAKRAFLALGSGRKVCLDAEAINLVASRRSLCAARHLPAGTVLAPADLIALRPATGAPPAALGLVLGRRLTVDLAEGQPVTMASLAPAHRIQPPPPSTSRTEVDRVA